MIKPVALETFTTLKALVANPRFDEQRRTVLDALDMSTIDAPMVVIVNALAQRAYCFTLQCCYGHFLYGDQTDPYDTNPLPAERHIGRVDYRLAYVALCIENSESGKRLFSELNAVTGIDPDFVQFGCAEWFWQRQRNSYALQVAPRRMMDQDRMLLDESEARHVEQIRNRTYDRLKNLLKPQLKTTSGHRT